MVSESSFSNLWFYLYDCQTSISCFENEKCLYICDICMVLEFAKIKRIKKLKRAKSLAPLKSIVVGNENDGPTG